jgi:hypothetical protein
LIEEDGYDETLIFADAWPEDGMQICAEYDYSDAPDWANERSWYIRGQYELEHEEV